jgi:hypothetical protein
MGKIKKEDLESMKEVEEPKKQDMNPKDPTKKIKPLKAVLGVLALGALGAKAFSKAKKKTGVAVPDDTKYAMNKRNMVTDLYQKATKQKTANMNVGGEVEITKGKEYIKDLL